jgi:hypothetical protein
MWYQERRGKSRESVIPTFQMCCANGKVQLPNLRHPPDTLKQLLFDTKSKQSKHFQDNIRMYNSMFAFTSPGMKFDKKFNGSKRPPVLRLHGQPCYQKMEKLQSSLSYIFMILTMKLLIGYTVAGKLHYIT